MLGREKTSWTLKDYFYVPLGTKAEKKINESRYKSERERKGKRKSDKRKEAKEKMAVTAGKQKKLISQSKDKITEII